MYVFNEDCVDLIRRLDRRDVFFYCDPPYYGTLGCYELEFDKHDHKRLAEALRDIEGKFLLSYNDHKEIRRLYKWAIINEIATRYSLNADKSRNKKVRELLISNYDQNIPGQ